MTQNTSLAFAPATDPTPNPVGRVVMVSNPDGSQRPATPEDLAMPRFIPQVQTAEAQTVLAPGTAPEEKPAQKIEPQFSMPFEPVVAEAETARPAATPEEVEETLLPEIAVIAADVHSTMAGFASSYTMIDEQPAPSAAPTLEAEPQTAPAAPPKPTEREDGRKLYTMEELQHILATHAQWLQSGGKEGTRANFRNAALTGINFSGSLLTEASFRGADLSGSNFSQCDMQRADLSEAILHQTDLTSSHLGGAIFCRADMRTAHVQGSNLESTDFSGAGLVGANLSNLYLVGANFQATDLQSANLAQSNLAKANFQGANLTYANVSSANLSEANCRETNFEQAVLDGAYLTGTLLKGANLRGVNMLAIDLSVAAEYSAEHKEGAAMAEREQLQREFAQLQQQQTQFQQQQVQMQQREMALQSERAQLERVRRDVNKQEESVQKLVAETREIMLRHRSHDRWFKYLGLIWFMITIIGFTVILLIIGKLQLSKLNIVELLVVFGSPTLVLAIFIATTIRSIKLSANLKRLQAIYERLLPAHASSSVTKL